MQLLAVCQAFDAVVCLNYFIRCLKRGDAALVAEAPAEETSKSVAKGGFGPGSIMKKVLLHAAACCCMLLHASPAASPRGEWALLDFTGESLRVPKQYQDRSGRRRDQQDDSRR